MSAAPADALPDAAPLPPPAGSTSVAIAPPTGDEAKAAADDAKKELLAGVEGGKALLSDIMEDAPPPITKLPEAKRMEAYLDALASGAPGGGGKVMAAMKPCLMMTIRGTMAIWPWIKFIHKWITKLWGMLPINTVLMVFGASLCYFGGTYVASIATIEAFRQMGWSRCKKDLDILGQEIAAVLKQSELDDMLDEDDDGIIDVEELSPPELLQRKIMLVITTVKEPWRIQSAAASLWAAWLAVLAALKLEFAQTTAMAMGVVEMVRLPVVRLASPPMMAALGPQSTAWVVTIIESSLTMFAIMLAWNLQMIISAFYSGLRGGKIFAEGFFNMLQEKNLMEKIPGVKVPFDPNESVLDEIVAYIIAFQGFMFQIANGFALPFPFNIVMAPLTLIEWILRTQISTG